MVVHAWHATDLRPVMCNMPGKNQVLVARAGAIDALVAAMRAHIGNAGVSITACGAINIICTGNGMFVSCSCSSKLFNS